MMSIYYIILTIIAVIVFQFIRFKLTRWENIVTHFESVKRTDEKTIYGYWSEFRQSPQSYPLSNAFLKLIPFSFGLYLQYDLKYEPIKFYKPIIIPWNYISINQTSESISKGGDEYIIQRNGEYLGSIFLQAQISEDIKSIIQDLNIEVKIV